MKEEENNNSTFKKLLRKKWFYPAVYLAFAALILTGVIWYQNTAIDLPEQAQDQTDDIDSENTSTNPDLIGQGPDGNSVPVMDQDELLKMPVASADDAEIVTKFYDYDASEEEQEQALILYNNKYYQSKGIDIASANDESFDVTAALTGTVTEVKEDPLLGMVVELTHDDGLTTNYASLADVAVETGAEVSQGDVLGTAGQNLYGQANGIHVHFELRKDGSRINPEEFFNQPSSEIDIPEEDEEGSEDEASEEEETSGENSEESSEEDDDEDNDESGDQEGDATEEQPQSSASTVTT